LDRGQILATEITEGGREPPGSPRTPRFFRIQFQRADHASIAASEIESSNLTGGRRGSRARILSKLCDLCALIVKAGSPTEIFKLLLGPFPSLQQQLEESLNLKLF
jgi:hypothetical protein